MYVCQGISIKYNKSLKKLPEIQTGTYYYQILKVNQSKLLSVRAINIMHWLFLLIIWTDPLPFS